MSRITAAHWAGLQARRLTHIQHGPCHLTLSLDRSLFILSGPMGEHTLLADATPLARLNAHWRGFVANARGCHHA